MAATMVKTESDDQPVLPDPRAVETLKHFQLKGSTLPAHEQEANRPRLKRILGRWDLVLLFVVAVFNLNVVPSIAANGGVTLWL